MFNLLTYSLFIVVPLKERYQRNVIAVSTTQYLPLLIPMLLECWSFLYGYFMSPEEENHKNIQGMDEENMKKRKL